MNRFLNVSRNRKIIYRLLWNYNIRLWYIHDGHNLHTLFNGILCAANQELIGSCNLSFIYPEHDLSPFLPFFFPEPRDYTVIRPRKIGISRLYTGCLVIQGINVFRIHSEGLNNVSKDFAIFL